MTTGNPFRYQKIFKILHVGCHLPPSFLDWQVVKRQGSSLRINRYPRFCVVLLPLPVEYFQYFQTWNVMRSNLLDGIRPHFGSGGLYYICPPSPYIWDFTYVIARIIRPISAPSNAKIIVGHRSDFEAEKRQPVMQANTLSASIYRVYLIV